MMKAWILHDIGDIRYEDADIEPVREGHARVKVQAVGICGSDIPRIYKTGAHRMPLIPGHEFAGTVDSVGSDVDKEWIGRSAGIFPLIPCRKCAPCKKGMYEMCRNYDYIGSRCDGAFAEYVNVPVWNLIELPVGISAEEAAMLEPMAVAVNAVRKGTDGFKADLDSKVVVCGLGTIGLFVTMWLMDAGYKNIYVIGNKEGQRSRACGLGIPSKCYKDYGEGVSADADIREADIFFECIGKNETVVLGVDSVGAAGRVVLVGNPYSDMKLDKDIYWKILRNQLNVMGVWNSRFDHSADDDWHYVIERLKGHMIDPAGLITHRYPLHKLTDGLGVMKDKTEDYCKIMCVGNHPA